MLWGQAWNLFLLEMADAPKYIRGEKKDKVLTDLEEIAQKYS